MKLTRSLVKTITAAGLILAALWLMTGQRNALAQDPKMNPSGLPVPRFVSLRFDEVRMRNGPGERYPIKWVYVREGLPVEITAEFEDWRRVRDKDGEEGWIKRTQLTGQRTAIIRNGTQTAYNKPSINDSKPVFQAEEGVLVRLLSCRGSWCRVEADDMRGWMQQRYLWGVYGSETVR